MGKTKHAYILDCCIGGNYKDKYRGSKNFGRGQKSNEIELFQVTQLPKVGNSE